MRCLWGKTVGCEFCVRVHDISNFLQCSADHLMTCMAFESAATFSPNIVNAAGSGAIGLIQFMPQTAYLLGTSTEELGEMTAVQQLKWVERYFVPYTGRLKTLSDVYMAILWPKAVGKPDDYVLFDKRDPRFPRRYLQNAGLDVDKDGRITKAEATYKVANLIPKGEKLSCECSQESLKGKISR